jgi:hypothetical protein
LYELRYRRSKSGSHPGLYSASDPVPLDSERMFV